MKKIVPQLVKDYIAEKSLDTEEMWLIHAPGLDQAIMNQTEEAARSCGMKKVTWVKTGGVITTHGGPGAFGVVGVMK